MWDVITHDYNRKLSTEQVYVNARKHTRNGSIVVFHDSIKAKKNVLEALPKAITYWKNHGFESELL